MRIPLAAAALLALATSLARADTAPPPAGTEPLTMFAGDKHSIPAPPGSQVICDDPSVARGDIVDNEFVLVAGHEGQTLCGVRFDGTPRGVYLVTVKPASEKKENGGGGAKK